MLHPKPRRALSRMEARLLLTHLGRTQELDRLLDSHLESWADELASDGFSLSHSLYSRDGGVYLDLLVTGLAVRCHFDVQLDSIDCVFMLRERTRSFHALSAGALLPILQERFAAYLDTVAGMAQRRISAPQASALYS